MTKLKFWIILMIIFIQLPVNTIEASTWTGDLFPIVYNCYFSTLLELGDPTQVGGSVTIAQNDNNSAQDISKIFFY